jgi:hypothetical protein
MLRSCVENQPACWKVNLARPRAHHLARYSLEIKAYKILEGSRQRIRRCRGPRIHAIDPLNALRRLSSDRTIPRDTLVKPIPWLHSRIPKAFIPLECNWTPETRVLTQINSDDLMVRYSRHRETQPPLTYLIGRRLPRREQLHTGYSGTLRYPNAHVLRLQW